MNDTCNKCGAERDENSRFCMKCGTPYGTAEKKEEREEAPRSENEEQEENLRRTKLDKKWRQINTWATLVAGADGKQDAVANSVKKTLAEIAAPNLNVEHRHIRLAGLSGMFAGKRKQLVIENRALRGYHVFVSIEDYGKQLNVSWYLMLRENWLTRLLKLTAASAWAPWWRRTTCSAPARCSWAQVPAPQVAPGCPCA
ncbi:MAG: hypothetical protein B7W98_01130 [Parcubacteria group bacterium 20-58-5]|nr:MAG: hypothetical protein B7W98_01130 [Parcubacteria group bacterium 20-58-5]